MLWQDLILASGGIIFALLLLPMLNDARNGYGVNVYTPGLTCIVLLIFNITYFSLGLYFAAIPFTAFMWLMITFYSLRARG